MHTGIFKHVCLNLIMHSPQGIPIYIERPFSCYLYMCWLYYIINIFVVKVHYGNV
jgi:hypothetical protein